MFTEQYNKFVEKVTNLQRNTIPVLASVGITVGLTAVRNTPHRKLFSQIVTGAVSIFSFLKLPSPLNLGFVMAGNYLLFVGLQAKEKKEDEMKEFEFFMLTYSHIVGIAAYLIL